MAVFTTNLVIHTGTDFEQTFVFEDENTNSALNLNGYSGCAKIKKYPSSTVSANFLISITGPEQGRARLSIGSTITGELKPGKYFYDMILKDPTGKLDRVVEGEVLIKKSVTRL
tara:strand:+ start:476 stop:817 length:342 start_codon:yes stop_codon:yes gene_type:complete